MKEEKSYSTSNRSRKKQSLFDGTARSTEFSPYVYANIAREAISVINARKYTTV